MPQRHFAFVSAVCLFFFSCASTNLASFVDPEFRQARYNRVLVVVNSLDLIKRQALETRMVDALKDAHVFAVQSVLFFPPTRDLSVQQKIELLQASNLDAYVSIYPGDSGVEQIYIPPTGTTTVTKGTVRESGSATNYEERSKTKINGGYTFEKPWVEFQTEMFDVATGKKVWIGTSFTGGTALATFGMVVSSYCNSVVNELVARQMIAEDKPLPVIAFPPFRTDLLGCVAFRTYHRRACHWLGSRSDLFTFRTLAQFQDSAYTACNLCKPDDSLSVVK